MNQIVRWTEKTDTQDACARIVRLGGPAWEKTTDEVLDDLVNRRSQYYVFVDGGRTASLVADVSPSGRRYVKADCDQVSPETLLRLPGPPRGKADRRRGQRIAVKGQLEVHVLSAPTVPGRLWNLSAGGFSIRTATRLDPGTFHDVLIEPRRTPAKALAARVAWCQERPLDAERHEYQVGFEFIDIDEHGRRFIDSLLSELLDAVYQVRQD